MYCPNCAAPIDGVKFCRSCGSNVSLVPQAMSGQLLQSEAPAGESYLEDHRMGRRHRRKEATVEGAAISFFSGIGFIVAAIAILIYAPAGAAWGWSFLIPAFATIGKGVGQYLGWKERQRKERLLEMPGNQTGAYQTIPQAPAISAPTTSELAKPASVTEHTTRHLE